MNLAGYCLPATDAALNGVHLGISSDSVLRLLGPPGKTDSSTRTLIYPTIQIQLDAGSHVIRLITSSRAVRMPSGVRVGQSPDEVLRRLKAPESEELEEVTWAPLLCQDSAAPSSPAAEATFTWSPVAEPNHPARPLVQERRLAKIELASCVGSRDRLD